VHAESPEGTAQDSVTLPAGKQSGLSRSDDITEGSRRHVANAGDEGRSDPRSIGAELFDALLGTPKICKLYEDSRSAAGSRGFRLRFVLDPGQPEMRPLHGLPWELLYDRDRSERLACEGRVSIVRSLVIRPRPRVFEPQRRLRLLALLSSARDLQLTDERKVLDKAAKMRGLEVQWDTAADLETLERLLQSAVDQGKPFHALHLAGHGTRGSWPSGGSLLWERPGDSEHTVAGRDLAAVLRQFPDLQLVVLNACETADLPTGDQDPFSGVAMALLQAGVPVVIAMHGSIRDDAAVCLARAFYRHLAHGAVPEEAVCAARWEVWLDEPEQSDWTRLVLFQGATRQRYVPRWLTRVAAALLCGFLVLAGIDLWQSRSLCQERAERAVADANSLLLDRRAEDVVRTLRPVIASDTCRGADRRTLAAAHAAIAAAEQDLGNLQDAVSQAETAVRLDPERAIHRYNLGALLARAGRPAEAIRPLREALDANPRLVDAINELGAVLLDLGKTREARDTLTHGLPVDPESPLLHKNLGRALLGLGQTGEAAEHFRRALELTPASDWPLRAELYGWLASSADAAGDRVGTCAAVDRFRRLDPDEATERASSVAELARRAHCSPQPGT